MRITIKYFGVIAEETGTSEEIIELDSEKMDLESLKSYCFEKYEISDTDSIQIAVNQSIGAGGALQNEDEVAFLPPFSGG